MDVDLSHYAVLDLPFDATQEEIRAAYHLAARRFHPDTSPNLATPDLFYKAQKAYDVLSSSERRSEYDVTIPKMELDHPGVVIKTLQSKTKVTRSDQPQLVYVLVDITAKPISNKPVQRPLNLAVVLDRSTSMNGERMDMVKENANRLVRQLAPEDIISIITFSDRAEVLVSPSHPTDPNL